MCVNSGGGGGRGSQGNKKECYLVIYLLARQLDGLLASRVNINKLRLKTSLFKNIYFTRVQFQRVGVCYRRWGELLLAAVMAG